VRPNLVGQPRFEELRGHTSEVYSFETKVYAVPDTVADLARMIVELERRWLGE
jgi:hypothetical protein